VNSTSNELKEFIREISELREKNAELQDTLNAILSGEVDALIVSKGDVEKIYTLEGADYIYRIIIEEMNEGVVTINYEGIILYCNRQFATLVSTPIENIIGSPIFDFIAPEETRFFEKLMKKKEAESWRGEVALISDDHQKKVVLISLNDLRKTGISEICLIITDVTEIKQAEEDLKYANDSLELKVKERTAELEETLKDKDAMLKEIHHRVKNNLQIISSLLSLQSKSITDQKVQDIFMESHNRIRAMALVHEKIYQPKEFAEINFRQYVNELVYNLINSYRHHSAMVQPKIYIEDITISMDIAIIAGLIINELVSNSLKHAFLHIPKVVSIKERNSVKAGEIIVRLEDKGDKYLLTISDDGPGFENIVKVEDAETLGLQLLQTFVDQLEGEFQYCIDGKVEFRITFPKIHDIPTSLKKET
jgi:two-component system, sensor histidine kinase PdtaS